MRKYERMERFFNIWNSVNKFCKFLINFEQEIFVFTSEGLNTF